MAVKINQVYFIYFWTWATINYVGPRAARDLYLKTTKSKGSTAYFVIYPLCCGRTHINFFNVIYLIQLCPLATTNHAQPLATMDLYLVHKARQIFIADPCPNPQLRGLY